MISQSNVNKSRACIGISIPCFNEESNIIPLVNSIEELFNSKLSNYDYLIQFIDNKSTDLTREKIMEACDNNPHVCAIFNIKNFGFQSGYYGFTKAQGDCVITMAADLQEPVSTLPKLIREWEQGAKVVCAVKSDSQEGLIMKNLRKIYYKILKTGSSSDIIENFSGFGLYDRDFIKVLNSLEEPVPFMRTLVAEFGYDIAIVYYDQERRKSGKSKNTLSSLYGIAIRSFTNSTRLGMRFAFFLGAFSTCVGLIMAIIALISSIFEGIVINFDPAFVAIVFFGGIQICLVALIGEYLAIINKRLMKRPLVVEEKRINR